jgi:pescadillo protein
MTKISLDHIIKERYPTFVDALRDLDDALSLLFLFANLPSTSTVPPKTIALCQRLCLEFQHYLITSHSLKKSFLSIKGIYYQATIQGQDILWLVPYKFVQRVTGDVDFRIMGTFVEFYTTLLGFVNFRLYTSIGLVYPPKFNANSDELGGELSAFSLEGKGVSADHEQPQIENSTAMNGEIVANAQVQEKVDALNVVEEPPAAAVDDASEQLTQELNEAIDKFETTAEGADTLPQPSISSSSASTLFAPFTVFLSRETPRAPIEFILRAFGCKRIGWDAVLGDGAFTTNEADPAITHQIVDRPPIQASDTDAASLPAIDLTKATTLPTGYRVPGRTYIQPQWVWDCINKGKLLRPDLYAPGTLLPPHLSPWVKPTKGAYDPSVPLAAQEPEGEAEEFAEAEAEARALAEEEDQDESAEEMDDDTTVVKNGASNGKMYVEDDAHGMDVAGSDDDDESEEEEDDEFGGFEDPVAEDSDDDARDAHQAELEAEAAGLTYSEGAMVNGKPLRGILKTAKGTMVNDEVRKQAAKKRAQEKEELERRMGMMGRRKRKTLEKMLYSNDKKSSEAEALRAKRRRLEAEGVR